METWQILMAAGGVGGLIAFVCFVLIVLHARNTRGTGFALLTFFVPPVALYYAFAGFKHPRKAWIIAGLLLGAIVGGIGSNATAFTQTDEEAAIVQEDLGGSMDF